MSQMKILQEKPLNVYEAKKLIDNLSETEGELNFRAQKTHEYLQQVSNLDEKKAKELFDKLMNLKLGRLKEIHVQTLINILPKKEDEVKLVLQGYNVTLPKESIDQILKTVEEVAGGKK